MDKIVIYAVAIEFVLVAVLMEIMCALLYKALKRLDALWLRNERRNSKEGRRHGK